MFEGVALGMQGLQNLQEQVKERRNLKIAMREQERKRQSQAELGLEFSKTPEGKTAVGGFAAKGVALGEIDAKDVFGQYVDIDPTKTMIQMQRDAFLSGDPGLMKASTLQSDAINLVNFNKSFFDEKGKLSAKSMFGELESQKAARGGGGGGNGAAGGTMKGKTTLTVPGELVHKTFQSILGDKISINAGEIPGLNKKISLDLSDDAEPLIKQLVRYNNDGVFDNVDSAKLASQYVTQKLVDTASPLLEGIDTSMRNPAYSAYKENAAYNVARMYMTGGGSYFTKRVQGEEGPEGIKVQLGYIPSAGYVPRAPEAPAKPAASNKVTVGQISQTAQQAMEAVIGLKSPASPSPKLGQTADARLKGMYKEAKTKNSWIKKLPEKAKAAQEANERKRQEEAQRQKDASFSLVRY